MNGGTRLCPARVPTAFGGRAIPARSPGQLPSVRSNRSAAGAVAAGVARGARSAAPQAVDSVPAEVAGAAVAQPPPGRAGPRGAAPGARLAAQPAAPADWQAVAQAAA